MYTRDNNTCEEFENVIKDLTINPTVQKWRNIGSTTIHLAMNIV